MLGGRTGSPGGDSPRAAASFAISVWSDRTTAYSLSAPDGTTLARTVVGVLGRTLIKEHALTLGRARVTLVIFHPRDLPWNGARVRWWFASGHGPYRAAPDSRTRRLSPFVTTVRTTIALPAGGYRFRACFDVPNAQALLDPRRPHGCPGRGYRGGGSLPVGFPRPPAVIRAGHALAARAGFIGFSGGWTRTAPRFSTR